MSIYKMGVQGTVQPEQRNRVQGEATTTFIPPATLYREPQHNEESGFWTFVKYLGAGLTLWVGFEKAKELYDKHMTGKGDSAAEDEAAEKE